MSLLQDYIIFRSTSIRYVETNSLFSHHVLAFVEESSFLPEALTKRNVSSRGFQSAINSYSTTSQLPSEPLPGSPAVLYTAYDNSIDGTWLAYGYTSDFMNLCSLLGLIFHYPACGSPLLCAGNDSHSHT
jgi:hypothetical protein